MQLPTARIYVPLKQSVVAVHPGNFIGRLATATIHVPDPRVSEAHALVSLRGNRLKLLALRGKLRVDDQPTDSVLLEQGRRIALAEGIMLFVEDVFIPPSTLMLCGVEQGPVELVAATHSLVPGSEKRLRLIPEYVDGALAHLWFSADALWISLVRKEPELLVVGRPYVIEGVTLQVISLPLAGTSDTVGSAVFTRGREAGASLVVTARYTSVHIYCNGSTVVISGRPANLLSEMVRFGGKPVPWEVAARELWGTAPDRMLLRQNLDRTLQRLRERLREARLREDLVMLDGTGNIELVLHPTDRIVDET